MQAGLPFGEQLQYARDNKKTPEDAPMPPISRRSVAVGASALPLPAILS